MSRWQTWTRRLRSRHARTDARRAGASMVLARRARPGLRVLVGGARRTAVTLCVRPSLGLHVTAAAPRPAPTPAAPTIVRETRTAPARVVVPPAPGRARAEAASPPMVHRSAPAVAAASAARRAETVVERRVTRLSELVRTWARRPDAAARAAALSGAVRSRAARHEPPALEPARLVSAHRADAAAPIHAPAGAAARLGAAALANAPAAWPPPAAPAVDVEALTSQVMQQMDRRLVAYRERMGRV